LKEIIPFEFLVANVILVKFRKSWVRQLSHSHKKQIGVVNYWSTG